MGRTESWLEKNHWGFKMIFSMSRLRFLKQTFPSFLSFFQRWSARRWDARKVDLRKIIGDFKWFLACRDWGFWSKHFLHFYHFSNTGAPVDGTHGKLTWEKSLGISNDFWHVEIEVFEAKISLISIIFPTLERPYMGHTESLLEKNH